MKDNCKDVRGSGSVTLAWIVGVLVVDGAQQETCGNHVEITDQSTIGPANPLPDAP